MAYIYNKYENENDILWYHCSLLRLHYSSCFLTRSQIHQWNFDLCVYILSQKLFKNKYDFQLDLFTSFLQSWNPIWSLLGLQPFFIMICFLLYFWEYVPLLWSLIKFFSVYRFLWKKYHFQFFSWLWVLFSCCLVFPLKKKNFLSSLQFKCRHRARKRSSIHQFTT